MDEGLSLREFGREVGVTAEAVRKAIADGRIPAECVGKRVVGKGRVWPVIKNPALAADHWKKNRNPNQVRDKAVMAAGARRGWAQRRGEDPPEGDADDELDDTGAGAGKGSSGTPSINDYKRITEAYKARTAKLEYEERVGRLVPAEIVEAKYVGLLTALRNRLLAVPSDAKGSIPHLTVDEIETLENLISNALNEVADELDDDEEDD